MRGGSFELHRYGRVGVLRLFVNPRALARHPKPASSSSASSSVVSGNSGISSGSSGAGGASIDFWPLLSKNAWVDLAKALGVGRRPGKPMRDAVQALVVVSPLPLVDAHFEHARPDVKAATLSDPVTPPPPKRAGKAGKNGENNGGKDEAPENESKAAGAAAEEGPKNEDQEKEEDDARLSWSHWPNEQRALLGLLFDWVEGSDEAQRIKAAAATRKANDRKAKQRAKEAQKAARKGKASTGQDPAADKVDDDDSAADFDAKRDSERYCSAVNSGQTRAWMAVCATTATRGSVSEVFDGATLRTATQVRKYSGSSVD